MATKPLNMEPQLPWAEGSEDRLFNRLAIVLLVVFMIGGIVLNSLTLPEVERKKLTEVAPRLAKLIVEKKKPPPPPPPKKEIKKPEEKKKPEVKKKPKPKPKPKPKQAAREKAQKSGLLAMQDDLADLRDSFNIDDIAALPQQKSVKKAANLNTSDLLTAKAAKGSGGIKTNTLTRKITTSELAQRRTTNVKSKVQSSDKIAAKASGSGSRGTSSRSQEEIERVFQQNKGAIFSIYNRELRKDPSLQGKVVVELTIAADGSVKKAVIISSELGHQKLEKRLLSKIKKFRFTSKQVAEITVTYPIDFLPS